MELKRVLSIFVIITINTMYSDSFLLESVVNDPNFSPIFSIKFTIKDTTTAICEAHGLLPVNYTIRVLNADGQYSIDNNIVTMKYGYRYLMICEAKISFENSTWTKNVILFHVPDQFVRLFNTSTKYQGLIQFYHSGEWGFICDDNFGDDSASRSNGYVICRELGYTGLDEMKSDGTFGSQKAFSMDEVVCTGNEASLANCPSQIGIKYHNCGPTEHPAGLICDSSLRSDRFIASTKYVKIIDFKSKPSYDLDINQVVELNCIFELNSKTEITFEIWRIKGSENKMNILYEATSKLNMVKLTNSGIRVSYRHTYRPDKLYPNNTFICMVKYVDGGFIDKKELFIKYKYPIEQLLLEPITKYAASFPSNKSLNSSIPENVNSSTTQYASNSSSESSVNIVTHMKCSGDRESNGATFRWSYTGANGTNYFDGQLLDLNKVERRLPICCRFDHILRSGPYNISQCIIVDELAETPILKTRIFCGTRTLNVECPKSTRMVFSSIHAGYVTSCSQTDYDHCQHHTVTNFIREERCEENRCRIFAGLFKKSYFKQMLVNSLPSDCLNGSKPFFKMNFYCLDKLNSTVV